MKSKQIKSGETKNYDRFSLIKCNRKISKSHVRNLMTKMSESEQLQPIIIDRQWNIYDGQHRFEACKRNKMSVKYIMYSNLNDNYIGELNNTQKGYSTQTWIEHYKNRDFPEYKKLIYVYSQYPKIPKGVINLAFYSEYVMNISALIKDGKYKLSMSRGDFLMNCMNILNKVKGDAFSVKVCKALVRIFKDEQNRMNYEEARLEACSQKYIIQTSLNNERDIAESIINAYRKNKKGKLLTI